jgi:hypothetical protein
MRDHTAETSLKMSVRTGNTHFNDPDQEKMSSPDMRSSRVGRCWINGPDDEALCTLTYPEEDRGPRKLQYLTTSSILNLQRVVTFKTVSQK